MMAIKYFGCGCVDRDGGAVRRCDEHALIDIERRWLVRRRNIMAFWLLVASLAGAAFAVGSSADVGSGA